MLAAICKITEGENEIKRFLPKLGGKCVQCLSILVSVYWGEQKYSRSNYHNYTGV